MSSWRKRFTRRRPGRGLRILAAMSAGLVAVALVGPPVTAEDPFVAGSGRSEARVVNVGPKAAKLSLAPTLGVALADYLNTLGRGESLIFDWVALEDSIPVEIRTATPPLRAESTGKPECRDRSRTTPGGSPIGLFEQRARATSDGPRGNSSFTLSGFAVPGAFEMNGAVARSEAGVEKSTRRARGITEIGVVSLGGGAVVLKGLRWEAVHESGAKKQVSGRFTVEAVNIAGAPVPVPGEDLREVIGPINEALKPLGLALKLPVADTTGGIARISPLSISIFESPLRSQLLGPLFGGVQPVREPLVNEYFGLAEQFDESAGTGGDDEEVEEGDREVSQAQCNGDLPPNSGDGSGARDYAATSVLVTDITLGVVTGVSSLVVALGGAQAFTEGTLYESPFGFGGFKELPPPVNQVIPGTAGVPPVPGTPGTPGTQPELATESAPAARTVPGTRGGAALWIGLAGLLLTALIAGRDWWLIRRGRDILPTGPAEA